MEMFGTKKDHSTIRDLHHIKLFGEDVYTRNGIFNAYKILNYPVFNVIIDNLKDDVINIEVKNFYNICSIEEHDSKQFLDSYYNIICKKIDKLNFYKWECFMYIHSWQIDISKKVNKRGEYITDNTYESNRFTKVEIEKKKYLFDSKYYLFHKI